MCDHPIVRFRMRSLSKLQPPLERRRGSAQLAVSAEVAADFTLDTSKLNMAKLPSDALDQLARVQSDCFTRYTSQVERVYQIQRKMDSGVCRKGLGRGAVLSSDCKCAWAGRRCHRRADPRCQRPTGVNESTAVGILRLFGPDPICHR